MSRRRFDFPKKGPIPHDAVHLIVESALEMTQGFWGMVAGGADPMQIQDLAKAAGHASAKRAMPPEPTIVELIQAERLVECFEAELWSPGADLETFRGVAAAACEASHVPCPDLPDAVIVAIRNRIAAFAYDWRELQMGQDISLRWPA
jgi:hypothetical protein